MDVGDNFSFDYSVNDDLLDLANVDDKTDRSEVQQKLFLGMPSTRPFANSDDPGRNRRSLQSGKSTKLFNPIMCLTEGDAVFFNVVVLYICPLY